MHGDDHPATKLRTRGQSPVVGRDAGTSEKKLMTFRRRLFAELMCVYSSLMRANLWLGKYRINNL